MRVPLCVECPPIVTHPRHRFIPQLPRLWCIALLLMVHSVVAAADQVITIYPVTTGSSQGPDRPLSKIVILSSQAGRAVDAALAAARDVFERGGLTVLNDPEPSRPAETHGPVLRNRSQADAGLLAIGRRAGADHVVVVEVTDNLMPDDTNSTGGYLHDERVTVKGIGVKTGTVVLEGTARWSQPIERPGEHLRELTAYAIARAICAPEKWVEASAANQGRGRCRG